MAVLTARGCTSSSWVGAFVAPAVAAVDGGTSLDASLCVLPSHGLLLRLGHVGLLSRYRLILAVDHLPVVIEVDVPTSAGFVGQLLVFAGREFVLPHDLLRSHENSKQILVRESALVLEPREVLVAE
jgi:hypothetical protein